MELDTVDRAAGDAANPGTNRGWSRRVTMAVFALIGLIASGCGSQAPSTPVRSTRPGAHQTVQGVLDAQSTALLAGDEAGFLADVDSTRPDVVARYRQLFANLRALEVTGWDQAVSGVERQAPMRVPPDPVEVTVGYCLGIPDCPRTLPGAAENGRITMRVGFAATADRIVITDLVAASAPAGGELLSTSNPRVGPMPWQLSPLVVATGARTMVATTADLSDRLPATLAAAEAAAEVADEFAEWVTPPRYYVYLAGPAQWSTWYAESPRGSEAGQAITTGSRSVDIILKAADITDGALGAVLRHQMGHVVTMIGVNRQFAGSAIGSQWVHEGMAEAVRYATEPRSTVESALASLQGYLRTITTIETFLDAGRPTDRAGGDAFDTASFLAIRYIHAKYGVEPLFAFAAEVLRAPFTVDQATIDVFQALWSDLEAEIWFAIFQLG
jgi:hypothetical protein